MIRFLLPILLLAAAGTLDLFDARTGERVGTLREAPGRSVDVYDSESRRIGWGRRNPDGSVELFDMQGTRIGTVTRDGRVILFAPLRPQERR